MYHDYSCCRDKVNRAAGRRAVVMVFASPLRQFYHDGTNPAHLSGLSHLDNFIMTQNFRPFTGTLQKHMPTLTQTATPHTTGPLCVSGTEADDYTDSKIHHTHNSKKIKSLFLNQDFQRSSKSLTACHHDSLRCCQTHAFLPFSDL